MNFPPHFLVLLFKTAFHLNASTKFALLGLNLFIFLKASISSLILLGFSDFRLSNRLENPVAIYPSMTVEYPDIDIQIKCPTSRFFCRKFLAIFSPIFEVKSFSFLTYILFQKCRKCLSINLRKYLYFSQG